ncbi:MAG: hypothetical protein FWD12_08910 [Alphaproteobacteria bacterium]|nr:hypothetical protein [Alphaproteobacteria bacterium]
MTPVFRRALAGRARRRRVATGAGSSANVIAARLASRGRGPVRLAASPVFAGAALFPLPLWLARTLRDASLPGMSFNLKDIVCPRGHGRVGVIAGTFGAQALDRGPGVAGPGSLRGGRPGGVATMVVAFALCHVHHFGVAWAIHSGPSS